MNPKSLTILGCSSQQPTRTRNHSGYFLRWGLEGFLFDPGEGTQRQLIFANISPTSITRIFISHFHGDHCLGLSSILMRLNLANIDHQIHCYYPASGKVYFDRLRFCSIYHDHIEIVEHPVSDSSAVYTDDNFTISGYFLDHGRIDNIGWRISEHDSTRFDADALKKRGISGLTVKQLKNDGHVRINGKIIMLSEVSYMKKGEVFAVGIDTLPTKTVETLAQDADLFLCESTYLEEHRDRARVHYHMTAKQAATIARRANVKKLILTHYSARYIDVSEFLKEARAIFQNTFTAEDFKYFTFPSATNKVNPIMTST